jgi:hypothetical protein
MPLWPLRLAVRRGHIQALLVERRSSRAPSPVLTMRLAAARSDENVMPHPLRMGIDLWSMFPWRNATTLHSEDAHLLARSRSERMRGYVAGNDDRLRRGHESQPHRDAPVRSNTRSALLVLLGTRSSAFRSIIDQATSIECDMQRPQARLDVIDRTEGFYNVQRVHSSIEYPSPLDVRKAPAGGMICCTSN